MLHIETTLKCRSRDLVHARRMFSAEVPVPQSKIKIKKKGEDFGNERVRVHCLIMDQTATCKYL